MKLLFDENLSPRLARSLADVYPDSAHVMDVGLSEADDRAIWMFARERGFAIVSKNGDFRQLSFLDGPPSKVVWVASATARRTTLQRCCGGARTISGTSLRPRKLLFSSSAEDARSVAPERRTRAVSKKPTPCSCSFSGSAGNGVVGTASGLSATLVAIVVPYAEGHSLAVTALYRKQANAPNRARKPGVGLARRDDRI